MRRAADGRQLVAATAPPVNSSKDYSLYMIISFFGDSVRSFSSRPQYAILGTGILGQIALFECRPSGGGSNAPCPAVPVPHLDVNADRR